MPPQRSDWLKTSFDAPPRLLKRLDDDAERLGFKSRAHLIRWIIQFWLLASKVSPREVHRLMGEDCD